MSLVVLCLFCSYSSEGQTFTTMPAYAIDIAGEELLMADINGNDTLEVLLAGKDSLGFEWLKIYETDTAGSFLLYHQRSLPSLTNVKIKSVDINHDILIDLVIGGIHSGQPYRNILLNEFGQSFYDYPKLLPPPAMHMCLSDFTNDGTLDFIVSKAAAPFDSLLLYSNHNGDFLQDSLLLTPLTNGILQHIDVNNDGFMDIVGMATSEKYSDFYLYKNIRNKHFPTTLLFTMQIDNPLIVKGDFTQNGFTDLVIGGIIDGKDSIVVFGNEGGSFSAVGSLSVPNSLRQILVADMTNDGVLDLLLLTSKQLILYYFNGGNAYDTLIITTEAGLDRASLGDFDRDYDQDIVVSGRVKNQPFLQIIRNDNIGNAPPFNPELLYALPRGDSVRLLWGDGIDVTTPIASLTYNLFLSGSSGSLLPVHSFDHRAITAYGHMEHANEITMKGLTQGMYVWYVQAEDNSLVVRPARKGEPCKWVFEVNSVQDNNHNVCSGDTVLLSTDPPVPVQWYSLNRGALTYTDSLYYVPDNKDDTIFANYRDFKDSTCATRTFVAYISVVSEGLLDLSDQELCAGDELQLSVPDIFNEVNWYFKRHGDTISGNTITYLPQLSDTLLVTAQSDSSCLISKEITITVHGLPEVDAGPDVRITKGKSVILQASGASQYVWSPVNDLDDPFIANPIASPTQTTTYTVTGTDQNGCSARDAVTVFVQETVYIPNLFSPNNDGNNDHFKAYAVNIRDISLQVFDLQGRLVFSASNPQEALGAGWDGTFNGKSLPQGTYMWSVSAVFVNGTTYKQSGKVTLIR